MRPFSIFSNATKPKTVQCYAGSDWRFSGYFFLNKKNSEPFCALHVAFMHLLRSRVCRVTHSVLRSANPSGPAVAVLRARSAAQLAISNRDTTRRPFRQIGRMCPIAVDARWARDHKARSIEGYNSGWLGSTPAGSFWCLSLREKTGFRGAKRRLSSPTRAGSTRRLGSSIITNSLQSAGSPRLPGTCPASWD